MKKSYNNDIYKMYEEEYNKNKLLIKEINDLRLKVYSLNSDLTNTKNKINKEIEKSVKLFVDENKKLKSDLEKAYKEINRLKKQINNIDKDYLIDKLTNQINKDSSNSSIPTSKEINYKRRTNTYNHRNISSFSTKKNQIIKALL